MDSVLNFDQEILKLEEKVKAANLPSDLVEKVSTMLSIIKMSLKTGNSQISNFENIQNYINLVCLLPFNMETKDTMDINFAREVLDKNHYGLESVKNTILEYLSSLILSMEKASSGEIKAPILCLVGLAGTGKTTLAYSIAESLGRKYERIPFGGMGDSLSLRGQSRSFPDAEPGFIIKKLVHAKSRNTVILLDELDRVSDSARADIMGVLVELLDSEQNKNFSDHYIDYPFDLSHVLFIATANNTTNVSTAVLDRMEIIQMPSYSDEEKEVIGKNYLLPKIIAQAGLANGQISIDESVWPVIIRPLGFDSGTRSLARTLETLSRRVARMIVEGKLDKNGRMVINNENIKQFIS